MSRFSQSISPSDPNQGSRWEPIYKKPAGQLEQAVDDPSQVGVNGGRIANTAASSRQQQPVFAPSVDQSAAPHKGVLGSAPGHLPDPRLAMTTGDAVLAEASTTEVGAHRRDGRQPDQRLQNTVSLRESGIPPAVPSVVAHTNTDIARATMPTAQTGMLANTASGRGRKRTATEFEEAPASPKQPTPSQVKRRRSAAAATLRKVATANNKRQKLGDHPDTPIDLEDDTAGLRAGDKLAFTSRSQQRNLEQSSSPKKPLSRKKSAAMVRQPAPHTGEHVGSQVAAAEHRRSLPAATMAPSQAFGQDFGSQAEMMPRPYGETSSATSLERGSARPLQNQFLYGQDAQSYQDAAAASRQAHNNQLQAAFNTRNPRQPSGMASFDPTRASTSASMASTPRPSVHSASGEREVLRTNVTAHAPSRRTGDVRKPFSASQPASSSRLAPPSIPAGTFEQFTPNQYRERRDRLRQEKKQRRARPVLEPIPEKPSPVTAKASLMKSPAVERSVLNPPVSTRPVEPRDKRRSQSQSHKTHVFKAAEAVSTPKVHARADVEGHPSTINKPKRRIQEVEEDEDDEEPIGPSKRQRLARVRERTQAKAQRQEQAEPEEVVELELEQVVEPEQDVNDSVTSQVYRAPVHGGIHYFDDLIDLVNTPSEPVASNVIHSVSPTMGALLQLRASIDATESRTFFDELLESGEIVECEAPAGLFDPPERLNFPTNNFLDWST